MLKKDTIHVFREKGRLAKAVLCKQKYLDDVELSLLRVLRWNKDGARQTAMLVGVIWFSSTKATTSLRKNRRIFRASRFSSGRRRTAAWTAQNCWSFGRSIKKENMKHRFQKLQRRHLLANWLHIYSFSRTRLQSPSGLVIYRPRKPEGMFTFKTTQCQRLVSEWLAEWSQSTPTPHRC